MTFKINKRFGVIMGLTMLIMIPAMILIYEHEYPGIQHQGRFQVYTYEGYYVNYSFSANNTCLVRIYLNKSMTTPVYNISPEKEGYWYSTPSQPYYSVINKTSPWNCCEEVCPS